VLACGLDGRITFANAAALTMLQVPAEHLEAQAVQDLVRVDARHAPLDFALIARVSGPVGPTALLLQAAPHCAKVDVLATLTPTTDDEGVRDGYVMSLEQSNPNLGIPSTPSERSH